MNRNFRLVPKFTGNMASVFFVYPNGESQEICRVNFPRDSQLKDNFECVEEIIVSLRKRIRKSL